MNLKRRSRKTLPDSQAQGLRHPSTCHAAAPAWSPVRSRQARSARANASRVHEAAPQPLPASTCCNAEVTTKSAPFSFDNTWENNTPRNKDTPLATKYFVPEIRVDTNFIESYNQPKDHTMGGSTESFRNGEFQLEQMSVGGDLRIDNVRARLLTMADCLRPRRRATTAAPASANGTSTTLTSTSPKHGAATTST